MSCRREPEDKNTKRRKPVADLLLVNDHDPEPLFHQFSAEYPGIFEWKYEQEGPDVWQVRISRLVA